MFQQDLTDKQNLTAYLLGIRRREDRTGDAEEHLDELQQLAGTMGLDVAGSEIAPVMSPSPKYLVGSGKAEQVKANAAMADAKLIVVDDDLTPAQQRNWEKLTELAVIDRREVILDIFAQRAQTREARLQVHLAQLEYSLPRLRRAWTHLERQRGGGGFMGGAGEAQIEVDRRIVRDNIARLKEELRDVRRQRATQRKARLIKPVPTASLAGYTNAGKSSLLNKLTGAGVLEEDKLFATLDPTTRRIVLPNRQEMLITDTVGFIRKLPHMLVEAFMATLEEAQMADLLLHVVDASHPASLDHLRASNAVLEEVKAAERPVLYVLNKIDLVQDQVALAELRNACQPHVLTSTLTGQGLDDLQAWLGEFVTRDLARVSLCIPPSRYDLVSFLHREGHVIAERYEEDGTHLEAELPRKHHSRFAAFLVEVNGDEMPRET